MHKWPVQITLIQGISIPWKITASASWAVDFASNDADQRLSDELVKKLFRIFLLFTDELDSAPNVVASARSGTDSADARALGNGRQRGAAQCSQLLTRRHKLTAAEVRLLCALFAREIGAAQLPACAVEGRAPSASTASDWSCLHCACELRRHVPDIPAAYTFKELIWLLGRLFPDRLLLEAAIDAVSAKIVNQILHSGFVFVYRRVSLAKRLTAGARWGHDARLHWCVVSPGKLHLWPVAAVGALGRAPDRLMAPGAAKCAMQYNLDENAKVEVDINDRPGRFTWTIQVSPNSVIRLGNTDSLDRHQWVTAACAAVAHGPSHQNVYKPILRYLRSVASKREHKTIDVGQERPTNKSVTFSTDLRNIRSISPLIDRSPDLSSPRMGDGAEFILRRRLQEVERENHRLNELLQNQKQVAKDEEIVRSLATRMLDEDRERVESLQTAAEEQLTQLRSERAAVAQRDVELRHLRDQLRRLNTAIEHYRRSRGNRPTSQLMTSSTPVPLSSPDDQDDSGLCCSSQNDLHEKHDIMVECKL